MLSINESISKMYLPLESQLYSTVLSNELLRHASMLTKTTEFLIVFGYLCSIAFYNKNKRPNQANLKIFRKWDDKHVDNAACYFLKKKKKNQNQNGLWYWDTAVC